MDSDMKVASELEILIIFLFMHRLDQQRRYYTLKY